MYYNEYSWISNNYVLHHHQHILTDSFPHSAGEPIRVGLVLGFLFPFRRLLLQLFLIADPSHCQLRLHDMLKVLVNIGGAVLLVQVPHVLLNQWLLISFYHHAVDRRRSWDDLVCMDVCWDCNCFNFFCLPVEPVKSDSAQKCRTCLRVLWIKVKINRSWQPVVAGSGVLYSCIIRNKEKTIAITFLTCSRLLGGMSAMADRMSAITSSPKEM